MAQISKLDGKEHFTACVTWQLSKLSTCLYSSMKPNLTVLLSNLVLSWGVQLFCIW